MLSERDKAIIEIVDQFRLVKTWHIEELFFSKPYPSSTNSRICRRVLRRLSRDRYLTRFNRQLGGINAGSSPYIYSLDINGKKLMNKTKSKGYSYQRSTIFMEHTLEIADLYVRLCKKNKDAISCFQTEPSCWRYFYHTLYGRGVLKPDCYVNLRSEDTELFWFVEIDRGTMNRAAIVRKLDMYISYFQSGEEQRSSGIFPKVIWIVPDNSRRKWFLNYIVIANQKVHGMFTVICKDRLEEVLLSTEVYF